MLDNLNSHTRAFLGIWKQKLYIQLEVLNVSKNLRPVRAACFSCEQTFSSWPRMETQASIALKSIHVNSDMKAQMTWILTNVGYDNSSRSRGLQLASTQVQDN